MSDVTREMAPFSLWLARENYNSLDQEVSGYLGFGLERLAEVDPKLAYDVLVSVARNLTQPDLGTDTTTDINGIVLSTEQDGDAARLASSKAFENAISQYDSGTVAVEVGVFEGQSTSGGVVLQFVVELG